MRRASCLSALALLLLCLPPPAAAQDCTFTGVKTHEDSGAYSYHACQVPEGVTKLYFAYSYAPPLAAPAESSAEDGGVKLGNVIDIAVFDPNGYRGGSGSNKHSFSIALSAEHTTPAYIPGPLPAGEWLVELGVGWIDAGKSLAYSATVTFSNEPVGDPFTPPDFTPVVLSDQPGWYKGDLHCHSTHSDGGYPMEDVFAYAYSRGLDFIGLTDHFTYSQLLFLPDHQEDYADMLLIPGQEMTAYNGHANVYNYFGYVDYHGTTPDYDVNAVIDAVHAAGGFFSPNHPGVPGIPYNGYVIGLGWAFPDTDWAKVDFMEAINGPMIVFDFIPNPVNLLSIEWWDRLQDQGYGVTIRGGSDDHAAGHGGGSLPAFIGQPTTVVYATELSTAGIMAGIAQGHCYLIAPGPDGPELSLAADNGTETVIMGDTIQGASVALTARVIGGEGAQLDVLKDGRPLAGHANVPVDSSDFIHQVALAPTEAARYRIELWQGMELLGITNSLYVEPAADDDDDDNDDDNDDDDDDDDDDNDDDDDDDDDNDDNDDDNDNDDNDDDDDDDADDDNDDNDDSPTAGDGDDDDNASGCGC